MNELHEKRVSSNKFFRKISNKLDKIPLFKQSSLRAKIHSRYHAIVGIGKLCVGNPKGAGAEFKRAGQQYIKSKIPFVRVPKD